MVRSLLICMGLLFQGMLYGNFKEWFLLPVTAEQIGSSFTLSSVYEGRPFGFLANPAAMSFQSFVVGYGHVFTDPIETLGDLNGSEYEGIVLLETSFQDTWALGASVHTYTFSDFRRNVVGLEGDELLFYTLHGNMALARRWRFWELQMDTGLSVSYLRSGLNDDTLDAGFAESVFFLNAGVKLNTGLGWHSDISLSHVPLPLQGRTSLEVPSQYAVALTKPFLTYLYGALAYSLLQRRYLSSSDVTHHVALAVKSDLPTKQLHMKWDVFPLKQFGGSMSAEWDISVEAFPVFGASFYVDLALDRTYRHVCRLHYGVSYRELLGYLQGLTLSYHFD